MEKEQSLAAKLKKEITAANESAEKQVQLEQEKAKATEAERALVEKSLQAERQKVGGLYLTQACETPLHTEKQKVCFCPHTL